MTKLLRTGLSLLLAGTCSSALAQEPGFLGQYYKGTNFNQPVTSRIDPSINFKWGSGSAFKGLPTDNFSVRWSGLFTAPHFSGTRQYRFTTSSDDGMRLFLKDRLVIDQWQSQANKSYSHTVSLKPGERAPVLVEYVERSGNAVAIFTITDVPSGRTVPASKTVTSTDNGSSSASKAQPGISLDSVDLSWTAPLTRMDGSSIALSEIHHYEVRYGMSTKDLSKLQKVDSDETRYRFKNLLQGRWHFSITVVDDNGLRSPPSSLVSKVLN